MAWTPTGNIRGADGDPGIATVEHGANAAAARPDEPVVFWYGTVEPDNWTDTDIWVNPEGGGGGGGGADGIGITSVVRTSGDGSAGTQDTYTITYTDASTTTFKVTNGADGARGAKGATGETGADGAAGTTTWAGITDKPAVIGAGTSATAARAAINAGTSNLVLGTGPTTALAGDTTATDIGGATAAQGDTADSAVQGSGLALWTGTESAYNALGSYDSTTIYIKTA